MSAIAESPLILLLLLSLNRKNAAITTIGIAIVSGAVSNATAIDNAPKPTCDSPSPIIEYLLSTSITPNKDAHKAIIPPTIIAFCINA